MIINKNTLFQIECTTSELKAICGALQDALEHRYYHFINVGDKYPECEYTKLQQKVLEALRGG